MGVIYSTDGLWLLALLGVEAVYLELHHLGQALRRRKKKFRLPGSESNNGGG